MMKQINSLNYATEIKVGEVSIKIDFSDKRLINKVLRLMKKYQNIEKEIDARIAEIDNDEQMDDLDKLIAFSDVEIDVLTEFKNDVDSTFNAPVTSTLFGDSLPPIERYFEFFEQIIPVITEVRKTENEKIANIQQKYGLDRLKEAKVEPVEEKSDTNA